MSDIAQKLKQGNIFWKIPMKIPVNRHYYSLVTENVDSMCQTKTAGRGGGVYVLVVLREGRGWTTLQTKQGEICVLVFGWVEAPVCTSCLCSGSIILGLNALKIVNCSLIRC